MCWYSETANGDFLIDYHPQYDNVLFATGGSGCVPCFFGAHAHTKAPSSDTDARATTPRARHSHAFKLGDLVLISTTSIHVDTKLGPRYLGPFPITKVISPLSLEVKLPPSLAHRHNVFHPEKLRPFKESLNFPRDIPIPHLLVCPLSPNQFVVNRILAKKEKRRGSVFLVSWEGYPDPSDDTWEPAFRLRQDVPDLVAKFESETLI